jgi:hypothetical protein
MNVGKAVRPVIAGQAVAISLKLANQAVYIRPPYEAV